MGIEAETAIHIHNCKHAEFWVMGPLRYSGHACTQVAFCTRSACAYLSRSLLEPPRPRFFARLSMFRHGMIWGWVPGGQGCYRLTRGRKGPSLYREWVALGTGARFPSGMQWSPCWSPSLPSCSFAPVEFPFPPWLCLCVGVGGFRVLPTEPN